MSPAASFAAHYAAHRADLVRYMAYAAGRDVAEDLTQEAFCRAWAAYASFDARHSFRAWLFGIARHLVISVLSVDCGRCYGFGWPPRSSTRLVCGS